MELTLDKITACPFWDCGWCYNDSICESDTSFGCISLEVCKIKHIKFWKSYVEC